MAPELLGAVKVNGRQGLLMGVRPKEEFELRKWWVVDGRAPRDGREVVAGAVAARRSG